MSRSVRARAVMLLLIAGVLVGGSGAPVLDALLFHRDSSRAHTVVHFEGQGARHGHGDTCTLGWLLRAEPSTSSPAQPDPLILPLTVAVASLVTAPLPPTRLLTSHRTRAPPARSA